MNTADCRDEIERAGRSLRHRAARLRSQAAAAQELLRPAYLRRAAELELEAWATLVTGCAPAPEPVPVLVDA